MMSESAIREKKDLLRKQAHANRNAQENKDELSRRIVGAFMALPEYATAEVVMFYIDVRSEVRTRLDLELALQSGKTIVVPWCNAEGELELFRLGSMDELERLVPWVPGEVIKDVDLVGRMITVDWDPEF